MPDSETEIRDDDTQTTKLANPEDRQKVRQYYIDTDPKRADMQDTYSRVAFESDDDRGNAILALEQIQDQTEVTKVRVIIKANPELVEYLDGRGMIWYNPEEEMKLQAQEQREGK